VATSHDRENLSTGGAKIAKNQQFPQKRKFAKQKIVRREDNMSERDVVKLTHVVDHRITGKDFDDLQISMY
jgi:hypothetical protein